MGDADLTADSFAINYDFGAFQDAYLQNMVDAQVRPGCRVSLHAVATPRDFIL